MTRPEARGGGVTRLRGQGARLRAAYVARSPAMFFVSLALPTALRGGLRAGSAFRVGVCPASTTTRTPHDARPPPGRAVGRLGC